MTFRPLPPLSFLCECFEYRSETGEFFWKRRPAHHFPDPKYADSWDRQFAGKPAFTWVNEDGYRRGDVLYQGRRYRLRACRVAFFMAYGLEPEMIDHRNHQTTDDRIDNLRAADRFESAQHQRKKSGKFTTKLKGAFYDRSHGHWRARVQHRGAVHDCGLFDTAKEAHAAYCEVAARLHGEFFHAGSRPA